jgi:serine/threonine-protein kinase
MEIQEAQTAVEAMHAGGVPIELEEILLRKGRLTLEQFALAHAAVTKSSGPLIPGYEILNKLGSGGMGSVYRARQTATDRVVALKLLSPSDRDPASVDRFLREARVLIELAHPHLTRGLDVGYHRGLFYVAMECVDGSTLAQLLRVHGPLQWRQAFIYTRHIADALAFVESRRLVHRDIKPENILIDASGKAKLTDFGLARLASNPDVTQTGDLPGTPRYMSPEQAAGRPDLDHRSDLYSLGLTLFEMLCARPAFEARTTAELLACRVRASPSYDRLTLARVPEPVISVVRKLTAPERGARYQHASHLIVDLDQLLAERPLLYALPAARPALRPPPRPKNRTQQRLLVTALILSLLAGALAWFLG